MIEANQDKIRRSPIPDIRGQPLYTLREDVSPPLSATTESAKGTPAAIRSFSQEMLETQGVDAAKFYDGALSRTERAFKSALAVSIIGFAFFTGSLFILLTFQLQTIAAAGVIGSAIVEAVAGLQFYLYGKTTAQLPYYYQSIETRQRFLLANQICEELDEKYRQETRAKLVIQLTLSTPPTLIGSTERSKSDNT